MRRYLGLLGTFWKSMLLSELEYRANFLVNMLVGAGWAAWSVASVWVFFQHRTRIGDWTYYQAMVVLGLFLTFNGLVNTFMRPNLERLTEHIRQGTLDFILVKPLNSQFHTSLREVALWSVSDLIIGAGVTTYALLGAGAQPSPAQAGLFLLLLAASSIMLYSLVLILATTAFWLVEVNNIIELLFTFYEAGRFPVTIYPQMVRVLLTFVVPIALITTVPAQVVLSRLVDTQLVFYALGMAALLFALSAWYWRFALRHYSSASS